MAAHEKQHNGPQKLLEQALTVCELSFQMVTRTCNFCSFDLVILVISVDKYDIIFKCKIWQMEHAIPNAQSFTLDREHCRMSI